MSFSCQTPFPRSSLFPSPYFSPFLGQTRGVTSSDLPGDTKGVGGDHKKAS